MPWSDIVWNHEGDGNVHHIAENGLSIADVEFVVMNAVQYGTSRVSGRPILFGYTEGGDYVCVVYEEIDDITIYPVTAYILED
jgi:uncharacterized DUF497 family protein